MAAIFPHFSDPRALAAESDNNQMAYQEQALRIELRREAQMARALFLVMRHIEMKHRTTGALMSTEEFLTTFYPNVD